MAGRIVILLNHPDRGRQMGRVGQQMIAAKFSCAARLEKTERLYQQLLNDRRERT